MSHTPRNIQGGYTATDFWNQWNSVNPRMAVFLLVTPQSWWAGRSPVGFTSNTRNMTLPGHSGITFYASPGLSPSDIEMSLGETSNLDLQGVYQSGIFEHGDVTAGLWNYAGVELFSACWDNTDLGELLWFKGNLAEFRDFQTFFTAEGRGPIARLSNEIDLVTTRHCWYKEFRGTECGHSASTVTIGGNAYDVEQSGISGIASIAAQAVHFEVDAFSGILPSDPELEAYSNLFTNGMLTALGGNNSGVSREIAAGSQDGLPPGIALYLKRPLPYGVEATTYDLVMGCNRTPEDCRKFTNITRFPAHPFVPGLEASNRIIPGN